MTFDGFTLISPGQVTFWDRAPILSRARQSDIDDFGVERAVYLTVLHRLFASGSDRAAERWREDYLIPGTEALELHHLYRAMAFLGQEIESKGPKTLGTPRCLKDLTPGRALRASTRFIYGSRPGLFRYHFALL